MYQKLVIVGNLGNDPEMRYLPDGTAVTNLSIATNRQYTSNGEQVKETTWFRVSVWGKQAEACNEYLSRGRQVLVEGRLQPDKETGNPRTFTRSDGSVGASFEVRAEHVKFLGGGGDSAAKSTEEEDDVPF